MTDTDEAASPRSAPATLEGAPHRLPAPPEAADGVGLDERERRVLAQLPREGAGGTAFEGLRRRLDLHPQSLSRVLDRLGDRGLVAGGDEGYHRPPEGGRALEAEPPAVPGCPREPVAAGTLPPGLDPEHLREELSGRWFDGLRWYGWRDRPDGADLLWLAEGDDAMVALRLTGDRYLLGAEPRDPTAVAHPSVAAAPLVEAIGSIVGNPPGARDRSGS